jgi:hypothetical protein
MENDGAHMKRSEIACFGGAALILVGLLMIILSSPATAGQATSAIKIDPDDIAGTVTSSKGPEAGVWVIAETTSLPTRLIKIVVTDDRGRYLLPELPLASYDIWVRGYGLVDSPKVKARPGKLLDLKATIAPADKAAAEYYPALYWFSLIQVPPKSDFPGTGVNGNGISDNIKSQGQWIRQLKTDGCVTCHQLGNKATREIPAAFEKLPNTVAAWQRRVQSGQAGTGMFATLNSFGPRGAKMFADWTDRIAGGAVPPAPPRPAGVERNVVVTMWDWADPHSYLHDEIATDKRDPTVNAYGALYGSLELSADYLPVLDPVRNEAFHLALTAVDPNTPFATPQTGITPSPYWGEEPIWKSKTNVHNPMFDEEGRVWFTTRLRPSQNPDLCKESSSTIESAKLFPLNESGRQLGMFDMNLRKVRLIDTCFTTHHLQFAADGNDTLWMSSGGTGDVVGWLNVKTFDETGNERKAQGWTALVLDTNGNGKRDAYVEPNQPVDPSKDTRISGSFYGITVSPLDGSVWGSMLGFPGAIARIVPGSHPPSTALTELYEVPWNNPKAAAQGFSPRGLDITTDGVVWAPLASGHFASFDRRKCKGPLNGPAATGQHCPEGWMLYKMPGPTLQGAEDLGSAEASYYSWVDQFDTFGLGKNTPIATGNEWGGLLALQNGKWIVMTVPYPLGFYAKGLDGRIDDRGVGWKGKGLWTTYATRAPFHTETGKGTTSKVVHIQLRPDPLAK